VSFVSHGKRRILSRTAGLALAVAALPLLALAQTAPPLSPGAAQPLPPGAPQTTPSNDATLSVPTMPNRPLALEEGPRLKVRGFKLTDAHDHPKLGLTVASLNGELDTALRAQPDQGYTILQLQQIASRLADIYHKHGLILAQVVVPAQEIKDGVVQLRVLEGVLEAVKTENNKHNRSSALQGPFKPLVGKAFEQSATDAALLRLTEYPGLAVFGVVTPGTAVGTSDLVLRVQREQLFNASVGIDNFGTKLSGEDRGDLSVRWNSPLGLGDRFSLFGLHSQTPADSAAKTNYGGAEYSVPLFAARGALSFGYTLNNYDVGQSLDVSGKVKVATAGYHQDFYRTRQLDVYGDLVGMDKRADVRLPVGLPGQEHVDDVSATFGIRYTNTFHGYSEFAVTYLHGSVASLDSGDAPVRVGVGSSYSVIDFHLLHQQGLTRFQTLRLSVNGQVSSDTLATLDQIALGGPASLRGYGVADYVGDTGYYGTIEWVIGAPGFAAKAGPGGRAWGDLLQLSLFGDAGYGKNNHVAASGGVNLPSESLRDYGAALQFNFPDRFYARVSWAREISPDTLIQSVDHKTSHVYASMGASY
jgi:hemolysin activation/secretion protein